MTCRPPGEVHIDEPRFIVDHNAGRLVKWLRLMGYDTLFFSGDDDSRMVAQAVAEGRVILTRDREIMRRRVVTGGRIKAMLLTSEDPAEQMRQVMAALCLDSRRHPFTRCLECNHPLEERSHEEVQNRVPPYVRRTQAHYMECPACQRIYWRGTHWEALRRRLERFGGGAKPPGSSAGGTYP